MPVDITLWTTYFPHCPLPFTSFYQLRWVSVCVPCIHILKGFLHYWSVYLLRFYSLTTGAIGHTFTFTDCWDANVVSSRAKKLLNTPLRYFFCKVCFLSKFRNLGSFGSALGVADYNKQLQFPLSSPGIFSSFVAL